MKTLCEVYKSRQRDGMYLYVDQKDGLSRVPDELLERFGRPEKAMTFVLTADRRLAREDPRKVLENIRECGYHLQLPPRQEDLLAQHRARQQAAAREQTKDGITTKDEIKTQDGIKKG